MTNTPTTPPQNALIIHVNKLIAENNFPAALAAIDTFCTDHKAGSDVTILHVKVLVESGDIPAACNIVRQFRRDNPLDPSVHEYCESFDRKNNVSTRTGPVQRELFAPEQKRTIRIMHDALHAQRYSDAHSDGIKFLKLYGDDQTTLYLTTKALTHLKKFDAAADLIKRVPAQMRNVHVSRMEGIVSVLSGKLEAGLDQLQATANKQYDKPTMLYLRDLAVVGIGTSRYRATLTALSQRGAVEPEDYFTLDFQKEVPELPLGSADTATKAKEIFWQQFSSPSHGAQAAGQIPSRRKGGNRSR